VMSTWSWWNVWTTQLTYQFRQGNLTTSAGSVQLTVAVTTIHYGSTLNDVISVSKLHSLLKPPSSMANGLQTWNVLSSGMIRSSDTQSVTDLSGQSTGPIFKVTICR
jgi:hypothetical protein